MDNSMHKVIPEKMPSFTEDRKTKIYPTFSLDSEDLPELKDFKVGEKKVLVMEVEQMSMRQGKEWQGENNKDDKKVHATFKILRVGLEKETFENEYARRRSAGGRS